MKNELSQKVLGTAVLTSLLYFVPTITNPGYTYAGGLKERFQNYMKKNKERGKENTRRLDKEVRKQWKSIPEPIRDEIISHGADVIVPGAGTVGVPIIRKYYKERRK